MARFDRYLSTAVLGASLGVLAVLVGLDALSTLIEETGDLSDSYRFTDILAYVGLTLPRRVHEFVPFAALIGALIGLGRLASSSELVVARAAGISLGQIATMVLKPALIMALLGFFVGEFLSPVAEQMAISQRALAQREDSGFTGRGGAWNRDGDTFIHVSAVQSGGVIFGVTLLTYDTQRHLVRSLRADRGTFLGDHWVLEGVSRTQLNPSLTETDRLTTWRWQTEITPELLALEAVENDSLPLRQLWPYANYLANQGLVSGDVELAFWRKLLQPLAVAGLVLIAMSFIFGPLREGSMGGRIFAGVIVGVVFRISQDFFGPASQIFGFPAVLAVAVPIALCWLSGVWLLTRRT